MNFECHCCNQMKSMDDWVNGVCSICWEEEQ